jgi:hypothetical protein
MPKPGDRKTVTAKVIADDASAARLALRRALRAKAGQPYVHEVAISPTVRRINRGKHAGRYEAKGKGVFRVPHTHKG